MADFQSIHTGAKIDEGITKALAIKPIETPDIVWVNDGSPVGGDGTFEKPFNLINNSLATSRFGSNIEIAPGSYAEDVNFNQQNVTLVTSGTTGQYRTNINSLTIPVGAQRLGLANIQINGNFNSSGGLVYPDNIAVRGRTVINSGYHRIDNSFFADVLVTGNAFVELIGCRSETIGTWEVSGNATLVVTGYTNIKLKHSESGILIVDGVGNYLPVGSDNIAIDSDSNTGFLMINNANFVLAGAIEFIGERPVYKIQNASAYAVGQAVYASINKTGLCPCIFGLNQYDTQNSVLNGTISYTQLQTHSIAGLEERLQALESRL